VLRGFSDGWRHDATVELDPTTEEHLEAMLERLSPGSRGVMVKLATRWGSQRFSKYGQEIADGLLDQVRDEDKSDQQRIDAARQLVEFLPDDADVLLDLLDELTPQLSPAVATGIIQAIGRSRNDEMGELLLDQIKTMTPALKKAAFVQLLQRPSSTRTLLERAGEGDVSLDELALDQKQAIASHPDREIRQLAQELLAQGGSLPSPDRQKVLDSYMVTTTRAGDPDKGKAVFKEHCSKCHVHGEMGINIGPNLTGMAVHPKKELLTHILDPSRNVEGNFRAYSVLTLDGIVLNGLLASESKTAIELFDTEGKKKSVLRDDIDRLVMGKKSIMPEGFENSINKQAMTDLLEFLTRKGKFVPIPLDRHATAISTKGLFSNGDNGPDRMIFDDWGPKTFQGVPFLLTDPVVDTKPNIILLNGPLGPLPPQMPESVALPCGVAAKQIHLLSGVGGWSFPFDRAETVSMIVRLRYADGKTEDHPLVNGVHFADYIRRVDVPESEFAFDLRGQQIRYLAVTPERGEVVETIELVKGEDRTAPIVMAVTVESATDADGH